MSAFSVSTAPGNPARAREDHFVPARSPWSGLVRKGQSIRIVDLEGQQAVDTLFYRADDFGERYSSQDTVRQQGAPTSPPARR
jgi:uncharacterized protein